MTASRRLAAILVADLVGYSRLMGEDEAGTALACASIARRRGPSLEKACELRITPTPEMQISQQLPCPVIVLIRANYRPVTFLLSFRYLALSTHEDRFISYCISIPFQNKTDRIALLPALFSLFAG